MIDLEFIKKCCSINDKFEVVFEAAKKDSLVMLELKIPNGGIITLGNAGVKDINYAECNQGYTKEFKELIYPLLLNSTLEKFLQLFPNYSLEFVDDRIDFFYLGHYVDTYNEMSNNKTKEELLKDIFKMEII